MGSIGTRVGLTLSTIMFLHMGAFWGNLGHAERVFEEAVIHHTATEPGREYTYEQCREYHVGVRGWEDCGYHWLVQPDGRIDPARPDYLVGAHVKGHNSRFLGIAVVGKGKATQKQIKAIQAKFGHMDLYPHSQFRPTACPGEIFNQLKGVSHGL